MTEDTPTPPTAASDARRQFVVRGEEGEIVEIIYAVTQDEAMNIFCYPALIKEAYFGPDGKWTCEEYVAP